MEKDQIKNTFIVLLIGISAFSAFRYLVEFKARLELADTLKQAKEQLTIMDNQRQNLLRQIEKDKEAQAKLSRQNDGLKDYLKAGKERMAKLFSGLAQEEQSLEDLKAKFSLLSQEAKALSNENKEILKENDRLKTKLNSVTELKKAMQELKRQAAKVGIQIIKKTDARMTIEGNQGYVIKDGRSNLPPRVKIEVTPVPENK